MSTGAVESRVHDVSGMRAEDTLDRPIIVRVVADNGAGFYRAPPESVTFPRRPG